MCIQPLNLVFISASLINKLLSHLLSCTNNLIKVRTPQLLWVHMSFILQVQASSHVGVILFFKLSENKTKKTRLAAPLLFDCRKKIYSKPYFLDYPDAIHCFLEWNIDWLDLFWWYMYICNCHFDLHTCCLLECLDIVCLLLFFFFISLLNYTPLQNTS